MTLVRILLWLALRVSWARNMTEQRRKSRLIFRVCEHLICYLHREDLVALQRCLDRLRVITPPPPPR